MEEIPCNNKIFSSVTEESLIHLIKVCAQSQSKNGYMHDSLEAISF